MTSLPLIRRVLAVFLACITLHVDVHAQKSAPDDFAHQLELAYGTGEAGALETLVAENRLEVKPAVLRVLTESLEAEVAGDTERAASKRETAAAISAAFESEFGERSLSEAASYLERWSLDQMHAKLRADSLLARGRELRSGEKAYQAYLAALETYDRIGDRLGVAEVLGGIGVVHWFGGDVDSTLAYFERALAARRAVDDQQLIGNSLNDIGSALLYFKQDYAEALPHFLDAAATREEVGDSIPLSRTYNLVGTSYSELGRLDSALVFFQKAIAQNRRNGESTWLGSNLVNAGSALMDMGRSSEALSLLEEAISIAEASGDTARMAEALNWKGAAFRRVGDFESAVQSYEEVVRLSEATGDQETLAYTQLNIGVLLEYADRPARAVDRQKQALSLFESLADERGRLLAVLGLSNSFLSLEDFSEAEAYANAALEVSRELDDPTNETRSLITLGNVQVMSGQEAAALVNFSEALQRARALENPDLIWAALLGHGDYYDRIGRYKRAVAYYEEGLQVAESVRGSLYSSEERAGFLAQKRFAYEHIVHMLGKLHEQEPTVGHDRKAFEVAERGKARSFLDMLAEAVSDIHEGVDPSLLSRRAELVSDIGSITQEAQRTAETGNAGALAATRKRLNELEEEYQRLQREIRLTNPAYSALQYPEPTTLDAVQSDLLDSGSVLLQYALGDSSSALWVVTDESAGMHILPNREDIQEQIELLRFALEQPDAADTELYAAAAHELYRLLVGPAEAAIEERDHLIIVPDDILYLIPFEVLLTEPADGTFGELPYLVRRYGVSYGPSATVLKQIQDGREAPESRAKDLLAFGDPMFDTEEEALPVAFAGEEIATRAGLDRLPHSGTEVRRISSLFEPGRVDAFLREAAVEERLKAAGGLFGYRYIHFATHGLINERRPDFSSIVFTLDDDPSEDGFLQAAEIFNLHMNPDLVVLSACETGLGKLVRGEGIVGLTRAFMYAGAPSIVVSLWRVADESTSHLMQELYQGLAGSNDSSGTTDHSADRAKVEALRAAKLAMLDDERFAHPFYWAPFIMMGSWN